MERFFKRPWLIVAVIGVITVFFVLQLPRAELDNNNFRFVPEKDAERVKSAAIDRTFGSQIIILVGLERQYDTVLDADFLNKLRSYGEKLKAMKIVDSVTSIISSDYITGVGDSVVVEPLVPDDFSGTKEEIAELKDRLMSWDLYRHSLVSDDFRSTQVLVSLNIRTEDAGKPEVTAAYRDVKRLAYEAGFPGTTVYITGLPVFSAVVNEAMSADLVFLIPLVVIVVIVVLFLSFRRLGGIVLPLLTVLISATWATGAMPLFDVKLSILSTVLPVILVAVGSAYGIHVVSHYYDEMAGRRDLGVEEHRQLIFAVLRKIGRPVLLAALTTFAGFVSFCFTPVVPIFEFGIFSSFGVLVAFGVSLTLIPALFLIRGPARRLPRSRTSERPLGREDPLSAAIADGLGAIARRRRATIAVSIAVVILSCFGLSRLVIDNVLVEYFRPDTDIVRSDRFIRDYFGGSKSISVVVSSPTAGEVLRPDVLAAMDGLSDYLAANVPEVGKTASFTDLVKRINQVLNADESPDGLAPSSATTAGQAAANEEPAFGFGSAGTANDAATPTNDAATPAFGFGSFAAPESAPEAKAADLPAEPEKSRPTDDRQETLDALKMVELLNKAVAKSENRALSAEALVDQLYRAVNYRGAAYYEIPTDPARYGKKTSEELKALVSNYLVLLSGDISSFADDPLEPRAIRMNVQLRTIGQIDTHRAIAAIEGYAKGHFPSDVTIEIGGTALVEGSLNRLVVQSQLTSVALSLLMVFLILSIYYRSAVAGLVGLTTLSLPVLVNFAVMGIFGIKLNIGTAMVASVTVGIGIDYVIHYMAAYHHEYLATKGQGDFMRRTFLTSGKAILFNAVSVGAGFAVLILSRFNILAELGLLIALTMGTSALASLTFLPVFLSLINPAFIRRPLPSDTSEFPTEVVQ